MGAFEVIGTFKSNPGASLVEAAAFTGQTLQVRATNAPVHLEQLWSENKNGGVMRVRSPRLHDNNNGIRTRVPKEDPGILLPYYIREPLYQMDTLVVETTGGGAEVDTQFLLVHYENIEGSNANVKRWEEIQPQIDKIMGVEVKPKTGAEGKWGTGKAINSAEDFFQRPFRYAILGYTVNTAVGAVVVRGIEPGQLRMGGPGVINPDLTQEWFIKLSHESGQAAIPVFNSENAGSVEVEIGGSESEVERLVTLVCARLKS